MQNANLLVADVRSEEVGTFTEDGVLYKIADAHPILNKQLDEKGWFRTCAAAVWYNIKQKVTVKQKIDSIDSALGGYSIRVVSSLPANRDPNTLYFLKKS